jgi:hypothetical protein
VTPCGSDRAAAPPWWAKGIPLAAGATIVIDGSPNAQFTAISASATVAVAIGIESD